ncbi:MAG: tyrosine-type recombinase/integrase [Longibaculum sp.]
MKKTPDEVNPKNVLFEDMTNNYLRYKKTKWKGSTINSNTKRIYDKILPFFQGMRIYDITTEDIMDWKDYISNQHYSLDYSLSLYNILSNMFKYSMRVYDLPRNTVAMVGTFKRPDELNKEMNFWTYDEFSLFIKHCDDIMWKSYFSTLYFTGMRKGESQAIKWNDINFTNKTIKISKTLTTKLSQEEKSKGLKYKITPPKTQTSNRIIKIPDMLVDLLKRYYESEKEIDGFNDDCFVFGTHRFTPDTSIRRNYMKYLNMTNTLEKTHIKPIRIHDFRHSHASDLINRGANIKLVSMHLGHKDVNETLNTYTHLFPSAEDELMNTYDNIKKL